MFICFLKWLTTHEASYCFPNFGRRNALQKHRNFHSWHLEQTWHLTTATAHAVLPACGPLSYANLIFRCNINQPASLSISVSLNYTECTVKNIYWETVDVAPVFLHRLNNQNQDTYFVRNHTTHVSCDRRRLHTTAVTLHTRIYRDSGGEKHTPVISVH